MGRRLRRIAEMLRCNSADRRLKDTEFSTDRSRSVDERTSISLTQPENIADDDSDTEFATDRSRSVDERTSISLTQLENAAAKLEQSVNILDEKLEESHDNIHNDFISVYRLSRPRKSPRHQSASPRQESASPRRRGTSPGRRGPVPIHDIVDGATGGQDGDRADVDVSHKMVDRSTREGGGSRRQSEGGENKSPPTLKQISKKILVSMVYEKLRADQLLATRNLVPELPTSVYDDMTEISGNQRTSGGDCPDFAEGFVFGANAPIHDMLSRNNNHPVNDEDADTDQRATIKFSKRSASQDSQKSASSLDPSIPRNSRIGKDYYLFPIGSFATTSPMTKWKDVASVIPTGIKYHRNIDERKYHRFEKPLITISQGLPTSSYIKDRIYAVRKIRPPVTCMEMLLEQNENKRIFQETHAKFVCVNLMMGLRFLHEHDIAHGSICPRKIIINDKGYPCLTGFETAEVIHDRPSRPKPRINVEYSAAEQIYQDCISETTDIYSLGVLTYHMIYGRPPHRGKTYAITRHNALDKDFQPRFKPESTSKEGQKFISKCIRKYDDRRFNILHQKHGLFESVSWFSGLSEEKLYKQPVPSPLLAIIARDTATDN